MAKEHGYQINVTWTGNTGVGTQDYRSYERSLVVQAPGKPDLAGSSDPAFRGDVARWNPEELLLASLSACHMLWYLHLCSVNKIVVTEYQDLPTAALQIESSGEGQITGATLQPKITITAADQIELATHLHEEAHKKCFIAKSLKFPVALRPVITAK